MCQSIRHAKMVANGLTTYKLISGVMNGADYVTTRAAAQDSMMRLFSSEVMKRSIDIKRPLKHGIAYNTRALSN